MRILITRPEPMAQALADLLNASGHDCYVWPSLTIHPPSDLAAIDHSINAMQSEDIGIFVSPNAVKYLFRHLTDAQQVRVQSLEVYAIGPGTAEALSSHGVKKVRYPVEHPNSETLLAMPGLATVNGKQACIFRGESGRELIAEVLQQRGAHINYVCCYQSLPSTASIPALLEAWHEPFDLIIATSLAGLQALWERLPAKQRSQSQHSLVTSMSEKMLLWLQNKGFNAILPLSSANNQSIADWVNQLKKESD